VIGLTQKSTASKERQIGDEEKRRITMTNFQTINFFWKRKTLNFHFNHYILLKWTKHSQMHRPSKIGLMTFQALLSFKGSSLRSKTTHHIKNLTKLREILSAFWMKRKNQFCDITLHSFTYFSGSYLYEIGGFSTHIRTTKLQSPANPEHDLICSLSKI
jgi:hypothetical protein